MTESQVRKAKGRPEKIVPNGDIVKGRNCNLWYYRNGPLLSFYTDKKILARVW